MAANAPRSGSDLLYWRGDKGLWLLRLRPASNTSTGAGIYLADHPQRFVPEAGGAARIGALRRSLMRR